MGTTVNPGGLCFVILTKTPHLSFLRPPGFYQRSSNHVYAGRPRGSVFDHPNQNTPSFILKTPGVLTSGHPIMGTTVNPGGLCLIIQTITHHLSFSRPPGFYQRSPNHVYDSKPRGSVFDHPNNNTPTFILKTPGVLSAVIQSCLQL